MISPETKTLLIKAMYQEAIQHVNGRNPTDADDMLQHIRNSFSGGWNYAPDGGIQFTLDTVAVMVVNGLFANYYSRQDINDLMAVCIRVQESIIAATKGNKRVSDIHTNVVQHFTP